MSNAVSLKEWSEGVTPTKDDFLSWSNLVFQRSLQVKTPEEDAVSQYLFFQWNASAKDSGLVANTFERTFSRYHLNFQVHVMNSLVEGGIAKPIDFLDHVRPDGLLYRHLLMMPEVWTGMEPHQFRDKLHSWFTEIVAFGKNEPEQVHPSWQVIYMFKTAKDRSCIFNAVLGDKILDSFGLFRDSHSYFDVETFHRTVKTLSDCWGIAPAQVVYGLMLVDYDKNRRDYDRYKEFFEPYANDIRELIQFSPEPRVQRMRENLPESTRPITIDILFAFALAMEPIHLFLDPKQMPTHLHDSEAAQALSSAF